MKFFLAILLLVAVTSETIGEIKGEEIKIEHIVNILRGMQNYLVKHYKFQKIKKGINVWVEDSVAWLKKNKYYNPIVNFVKTQGLENAKRICSKISERALICNKVVDRAAVNP